jgi:predicted neuraminidase
MALLGAGCASPDMSPHVDASNDGSLLTREFIYEEAPFPSCHASTIAESENGLVAAWFGGSDEGNKDVGIWFSRHHEGRWTVPVEVANGVQNDSSRHPCWNPVLYQVPNGSLMLF